MIVHPRVSVIVPVFNGEPYLAEAVESLLGQTRAPDEVIVVDDGSTDGSSRVAAQFGAQVTVINQANAGRSAARNAGIDRASGDVLAFLDADDRWEPTKLERQLEHLRAKPHLTGVLTGLRRFGGGPGIDGPVAEHWTDESLTRLRPLDFVVTDVGHPASLLAKREVLREIPFPQDLHVTEDRIVLAQIRAAGAIGIVPAPLYAFRIHPDRNDSADPWRKFEAATRWLRDGHRRIGATEPEAMAAAYTMLANDIGIRYYRRRLELFYADQRRLREVWPQWLPPHPVLSIRRYPRLVLRVKDALDHARARS
jgi:glycosyltransferase involved in cell wall biosynthesis